MISEWVTDQGYLLGPAFALGLFLLVFVVMLLWLYRPGSERVYQHEAQLPFDEGARGPQQSPSTAQED